MKTVVTTLRQASIDSFLISFMFGSWGAVNLAMGEGGTKFLGGFQVVLSLLNVLEGTRRRSLATAVEKTTATEANGIS